MNDKKQHCGWTLLTLKEHFEERFRALNEIRSAEADALVIQAREYERRLESLNGEQGRIAKSQATYISREMYEEFKERVDTFIIEQSARAKSMNWLIGILGSVATFSTAIAAFFALRH